MSAGVKYSTRYFLARVANALEAIRKDLPSSSTNVETGSLVERFKDAYKQQLTTVMAFSGAAMAPALNPGWCLCCGQQLLSGTRLQQHLRNPARARSFESLSQLFRGCPSSLAMNSQLAQLLCGSHLVLCSACQHAAVATTQQLSQPHKQDTACPSSKS